MCFVELGADEEEKYKPGELSSGEIGCVTSCSVFTIFGKLLLQRCKTLGAAGCLLVLTDNFSGFIVSPLSPWLRNAESIPPE